MWIKRIILFVGGLFVMSLGVGLSIKSGLGVTLITNSYSLTLASGANIELQQLFLMQFLYFCKYQF